LEEALLGAAGLDISASLEGPLANLADLPAPFRQ